MVPSFIPLALLSFLSFATAQTGVRFLNVSIPLSPNSTHVVLPNFLGVSLELSFVDLYIGTSPQNLIPTMVNYFSAFNPSQVPLRLRVGGNSMDSSTFEPSQKEAVNLTGTQRTDNDVHSTYGPSLFTTLKAFGDALGGTADLIGLSLRDPDNPSNPLVVEYAQRALGSSLDAFLLGNEPDLYTSHQHRTDVDNYTTSIYFDDFSFASNRLPDTPPGIIAGPTICCGWDLASLLSDGFLQRFPDTKYVTLQHYPQHNCFGEPRWGIEYYRNHTEVVSLAQWQIEDLPSPNLPRPLVMSEFNTASCGGIPDVSDTFASALWVVDYTLQLASVGYEAAYVHTREEESTYSMFYSEGHEEPGNGKGKKVTIKEYITRPGYYALPVVKEALTPVYSQDGTKNGWGSVVKDLNIHHQNKTLAGYAIYDRDPWSTMEERNASTGADRMVLFNYRSKRELDEGKEDPNFNDGTVTFRFPRSSFRRITSSPPQPASATNTSEPDTEPYHHISILHVRYLTSLDSSPHEKHNISWSGLTLSGVPDGRLRRFSLAGLGERAKNRTVICDESLGGTHGICTVEIPPMSLALLWMEEMSVQEGANLPSDDLDEGADADDGWWDPSTGKFIQNGATSLGLPGNWLVTAMLVAVLVSCSNNI